MENILLSINVVMPLLLMMAVGYLLKVKGVVDDKSLSVMNKVDFRVLLSCMMFLNIINLDAAKIFTADNMTLIIFSLSFILVEYVLAWIFCYYRVPDPRRRSVVIQAVSRANYILYGMAITTAIFGEGNAGITALLGAVVIPFVNILAVIVLEVHRGGNVSIVKIFVEFLKNPLILGAIAGMISLVLGVQYPKAIMSTVRSFSAAATPLAFIILGGNLNFRSILNNKKYISWVVAIRLFLAPLIGFSIARAFFDLRGPIVIALFSAIATPTAVSSFNMAKDMGADGDLAGEIVVATTVVSIISTFVWVLFFKTFGML